MPILVHQAYLKDLPDILESGYLLTGKDLKKSNYDEEPMDKVFMTTLFNDIHLSAAERMYKGIYVLLFFDIQMMDKVKPSHWTNGWAFGTFHKQKGDTLDKNSLISIKYDSKKSPKENISLWNDIYNKTNTKKDDYVMKHYGNNEVVFKGKVPIKDNLIGIYYTGDKLIDFKNVMKSRRGDLKRFLDKYQT